MLPTSKTPPVTPSTLEPETPPVAEAPQARRPADPLRPIGPRRLRALRNAIREGTYPTDADVLGGLERIFEQD